jgi:hypothetical protein
MIRPQVSNRFDWIGSEAGTFDVCLVATDTSALHPTRVAKPPTGPGWVHEIKHDGGMPCEEPYGHWYSTSSHSSCDRQCRRGAHPLRTRDHFGEVKTSLAAVEDGGRGIVEPTKSARSEACEVLCAAFFHCTMLSTILFVDPIAMWLSCK